ncbi:MAG: hypothetical protein Q7T60_05085 [Sphingopyxis sp.]|nr:hypothetical protein [Sphingopyxis sp.]
MLLLVMALASSPLPAFNPAQAVAQCADENEAQDFDAQAECVKSLNRDHRELSAVYRFAKPALKTAIERCVADYSEDDKPDWNMTQICSQRNEALLTETSLTNAKFDPDLARVRCKKEQTDRPDLVLADCFKDEVVSARNFTLFQAIYKEVALQSSFQICLKRWTDDDLIDWGMVSYCAQDQLDGFDSLAPLQSKSRN